MQYRRAFHPGGTFFFTLVTYDRKRVFDHAPTVEILRSAFRAVMVKRPFRIDAMVVLPDHLHCILTLPPDDVDYSIRWRLIKTWFTKHCDVESRQRAGSADVRKGEQALWQHRYWEHMVRDETDYQNHVEYIHYNPVKHGYVGSPKEWPYSSFHRFVGQGVYPADWGADGVSFSDGVGCE